MDWNAYEQVLAVAGVPVKQGQWYVCGFRNLCAGFGKFGLLRK